MSGILTIHTLTALPNPAATHVVNLKETKTFIWKNLEIHFPAIFTLMVSNFEKVRNEYVIWIVRCIWLLV